jgi:energy-coupling factor transporter ATP-binding protein EcfA2
MLKRIHIKGFRSCRDVLLEDLGPLTALVGRNGSGKTNILRAIHWLARAATATDLDQVLFPQTFDSFVKNASWPSLTADVHLDGSTFRYSMTLSDEEGASSGSQRFGQFSLQEKLEVRTDGVRWKEILRRTGGELHVQGRKSPIQLGLMVPCLSGLVALLPEEDQVLAYFLPLFSYFKRVRYYPLDEVNDVPALEHLSIVPGSEYRQWVSTGHPSDSVLMRLIRTRFDQPAVFDEIRSLLGPKGLDLISEITVSVLRPAAQVPEELADDDGFLNYLVRFHPGKALGKGSRPLSYGELSLGTRRVLHMITSLLVDRSSLLLLEHPEDGIHRGLLRKLLGLLRANVDPAQIILTSHSAQVVNDLTAQDVRLVSIHRGATRVRKLTPKESEVAAHFIEEEGTLADFLDSVEE